jgi:hypothetical protein
VNQYEYGKTYTLLVKEGIKSKKGGVLSKPTKMILQQKINSKPAITKWTYSSLRCRKSGK